MLDGIPISELRLIVHSIIFTILFIGLMVAVGFWAYTSLTLKNPKEKEHLRRLKEKAQSDELAKKQFEKLERRNKRRRRRERKKHRYRCFYLEHICLCGCRYLGLGHHPGMDRLYSEGLRCLYRRNHCLSANEEFAHRA